MVSANPSCSFSTDDFTTTGERTEHDHHNRTTTVSTIFSPFWTTRKRKNPRISWGFCVCNSFRRPMLYPVELRVRDRRDRGLRRSQYRYARSGRQLPRTSHPGPHRRLRSGIRMSNSGPFAAISASSEQACTVPKESRLAPISPPSRTLSVATLTDGDSGAIPGFPDAG
jgi:hypothetical protein